MTRLLRDQRGYTLAEMLVSAAVIGLIMAGLFSLLVSGQQSYATGAGRAEAQQNARLVLERMVRELRTAGHDPLGTATFNAVTALGAGTGFVIRNDWSGDGVISATVPQTVDGVAHGEQITYTFNGTTLMRLESGIDGAAETVTDRISSVTLEYRDDAGNVVTTPSGANAANIRVVVLDVTTLPDVVTSGTATQMGVRSLNRVRIRNR
jgi:type IV pilus assembly protein PilW